MRKISLCKIDNQKLEYILKQYTTERRLDAVIDVRLYKAYRNLGYSTSELSEMEYMDRSTIYRRITKVDKFVESYLKGDADKDKSL